MKTSKKCMLSILTFLVCMIAFTTTCLAKKNTTVTVPYGEGVCIKAKDKYIDISMRTRIKVSTKSMEGCTRTIKSVKYENLTPKFIAVSRNGHVRGKAYGDGKIKVTVTYKEKTRVYVKCIDGNQKPTWATRTCQETKIVKVKVEPMAHIMPVGGNVTLKFSVDGKAYGKDLSVGVGINPSIDYADEFPADPVKEGYEFLGWYTKNGKKIGTTAAEIYPAFKTVVCGQTATVYAKWKKI